MIRIIDCLTLEHDVALVLLAATLCLLGCLSCTLVAMRTLAARRPSLWLVALGPSVGATAWFTHFVAMLAYRTTVPMTSTRR